jgi:two-component system sensor histidine kinase PhoQ
MNYDFRQPLHSQSLRTRLLVSVTVLLTIFIAVAMVILDFGFRDLSDREMRRRLEVQLLALISASDDQTIGELRPVQLAETRFENPSSGLYGEIYRDKDYSWSSKSMRGTGLRFPRDLRPGEPRFQKLRRSDGAQVLAASRRIEWQFDETTSFSFIYSVAEDLAPYEVQLATFRGYSIGFFLVLMALLLGVLPVILRRLLEPLRRVQREIEAIEAGRITEVGAGYPRELLGITSNLNTLLRSERERLTRYRNTLGNLAHSFKTPLAVMRNLLSTEQLRALPIARQLDEQVGRMDDIVKYQLRRAAASGGTSGLGTAPVDVAVTADSLRGALLKVYAARGIRCEVKVAEGCVYIGDQEDLTEMAGNLMDNAFKWARSQVRVTAHRLSKADTRRDGLRLVIEDDGPGIPESERSRVLNRGARLDERVSGQGIGLSVVRELVQLNGGTIRIEDSDLGGARIEVLLPPA